jgi:hypothetical protein
VTECENTENNKGETILQGEEKRKRMRKKKENCKRGDRKS